MGAVVESDVDGSPCRGWCGSGQVFHSASFGVCLTLLGRVDDAVQFQVFLILYHIVPHKSNDSVTAVTEAMLGKSRSEKK